jgi:serine/threonine-protein kinase
MVVGKTFLNYRITEKLGAGGQGTVYKAVDERLGRPVVIKVLSPELTAREVNLKRFQREAQLASSLDHPNICTIYGLHETDDGLHFIAMQYIEGKNVRQLVNGRPLSLDTALSIAYQVADALTAAHAKGIIHRDIKAGNVMVTDAGLVKVLDFGLAKLLDDGKKGGDVHLTELGVPYGTATYAAPEQASGLKVDHRADIFSTGVLLYEMLAGIWPFKGQTTVEVRYAVLHDTPEPVSEVRRDDPPEIIQRILDRALAKKPDERYQRIEEMRDDLLAARREVAARQGGTVASTSDTHGGFTPAIAPPRHQPGTGGGFGHTFRRWWRSLTGAEAQPTSMPPASRHTSGQRSPAPNAGQHVSQFETEKSIAILPFRNLSNDADAGFYEFSLADAVITELARNRSLIVRPSSMIVKYQGKTVDPQQVGRELNVSAVLVAGFLRSGGALRVNAQLVDVASGEMIWSDRIDASATDIIALQDTIAQRIAQGLDVEHGAAAAAQGQPATRNAAAYEEYLRGRDFFAKFLFHTLDDPDCDRAVEHFQHAIRLDPSFALAHSGLGACFANRVLKGLGGADDYELAENAFSHALELDPDIIEARILMVFIYLSRGEKEKARAEVARLSKQAPNEPAVYFVKGALHRLDGEYDRALRAFDKLSRLDPAARVVASYNRARVFMYQHRFDDALLELQQGARVEPNHPLIRTFQAVILGRRGDAAEAVRVLHDVLEEHPTMDGIRPLLAQQLIKSGDTEGARAQFTERVREAADADHDIAYWLATAHAMLGDRDEAFRWLGRAIDLGNENRTWFESDPNWEPLREDERFAELMRRIEREKARAAPREQSLTETPEGGGRSTTNPEAYEEYLRGRDASGRFIYHTLAREDSDTSLAHFRRAVELDPSFALAWCALGGAYANRVIKGLGNNEDYAQAEAAFEKALALDPRLLEARLHTVFVKLARGDKAGARALVEELKSEAPNDVGVHFVSGTIARLDGRYADALEGFGRMLRINPAERVVVSYNRARVLMYQRRLDDAAAELELGAQMEHDHPLIRTFRAVLSARKGDAAGAVKIINDVLKRNPRMDGVRPLLAQFLAQRGDKDAARAELTELVRDAADADHDVAYWLATSYAMLGERDEAFRWLERAIKLGNENRPWFESDPNWESLREDPRFGELMSAIGDSTGRAHEARQ